MESLNLHLEHLKLGGEDPEGEEKILESLSGILQALAEDKHRTCSLLVKSDVLPAFARLLQSTPLCEVKVAQVLAEIAKNEEMKMPCIKAGLVPILVPLLDGTDQELLLHAGRAVGRICYENNDLQEQLVRAGVIASVVRILSDYPDNEALVRVNLLALSNLADLDSAKEALSKTRVAEHLVHQLRRVSHHEKLEIILEVLQTLAENDALKLQLVEAGIHEAVTEILQRLQDSSRPEDMCSLKAASDLIVSLLLGDESMQQLFAEGRGVIYQSVGTWLASKHTQLQLTGALAIANFARNDSAKEALSKTRVAEHLVHQLRRVSHHEKLEIILEVLQTLAENDALKLQLVEAGIHEAVTEILQRLQDSSRPEDMCSLKAASDLIVSLLLGDESMQQLFAEGRGVIYQSVGTWLASKHTQLQLTGALAIANFARNDSNCVRMVQLGVVHQLLDLLEQHVESGDVSVQHAALSALRNLAIPVANKMQMLEEGVGKRIQMLLRSEMLPVQFKLLGTLRMLMDGQAEAAEEMGQDPTLLRKLVQWCDSKDHAGVCGEANRLLASLIRHSRSKEVVKAIQEAQGVKHLVSMASSEHVIMQNEALIALAIASAICLEDIKEAFKEAKLVQNIHELLQEESTGPEVKYNAMGLLCSLLNSAELRQEAEEDHMKGTLEALCGHSNGNVAKQALMALQILNEEHNLLGP